MFWMLIGCASLADNEEEEVEVVEEKIVLVAPTITVDSPLRGEFVFYDEIAVSGTATEGTAPIARMLLNDQDLDVINGNFAVATEGNAGINILNFRLEAEDGKRSVDSMSVYKGPFHPIGEMVSSGIRLQIGQALLDDGDPDPDDLASIAEDVINELDLEAVLVGETYEVSGVDVTPVGFSHGGIDLQIQTGDSLTVLAVISDLDMDLEVEYGLTLDGEVTASSVQLEIVLGFDVDAGEVEVIPESTTASFSDLELEIELIPGWLENLIRGWAEDNIEEMLSEEASTLIKEIASDYLNSFIIDSELFAGVNLKAEVSELGVGEEGLRIVADALFYGPIVKELSSQVGSAKIAGDPPDWPLSSTKPFAAAVSGDLANQLMFSAWATGYFDNIELNGFLIQGLAGDSLPPPIGPVEKLVLNLALPPSLHIPSVDGMTADMAIGEWQMHFFRDDGEEIDFRINMRSGIFAHVNAGRIELNIDDRPAEIELGVATLAAPEYLDKGDLSALGRLMVPSLLGSVENYLPSIELPPIPLEGIYEGLEGEELLVNTADITVTNQAWALIEAELE